MAEGSREHLLEDVLGVVLAQAVGAHGDRVDVARVALDEGRPGALVAGCACAARARRREDR